MPRRGDTELVDAVAHAAALTRGQRRALGSALEAEKARGGGGSRNARGDFTAAELRSRVADAPGGAAIDAAIGRRAARGATERRLGGLVGTAIQSTTATTDGGLVLRFSAGELQLPAPTRWLLRRGVELIARAGDDDAHLRDALRALDGRTVTEAHLRRRDLALTLCFDDDPYCEAWELSVRGPRGGERWVLVAPDETPVVVTELRLSGL